MADAEIARLIEKIDESAVTAVEKALEAGADPVQLLEQGVIVGLRLIGDKFEAGEYFLPELLMGGEIAESCISRIKPYLPDGGAAKRGVVVIGAVRGDLHDLGYSLVARQLELAGFEVHELGVNVAPMAFIDKAEEVNAHIIGLSTFLITTIPNCAEVVSYARDMGLRDRLRIIIGGGETTAERAKEVGADGWAANAVEAVALCERLMGDKA